ncbi:hypothetical protein XENTR_v10013681 [Xenopus tropicalis]|nr:hypothetical protein XENTR_v10013681 [Xenopus tropicalis]
MGLMSMGPVSLAFSQADIHIFLCKTWDFMVFHTYVENLNKNHEYHEEIRKLEEISFLIQHKSQYYKNIWTPWTNYLQKLSQ